MTQGVLSHGRDICSLLFSFSFSAFSFFSLSRIATLLWLDLTAYGEMPGMALALAMAMRCGNSGVWGYFKCKWMHSNGNAGSGVFFWRRRRALSLYINFAAAKHGIIAWGGVIRRLAWLARTDTQGVRQIDQKLQRSDAQL
jgi:hypothetical protein